MDMSALDRVLIVADILLCINKRSAPLLRGSLVQTLAACRLVLGTHHGPRLSDGAGIGEVTVLLLLYHVKSS